MTPPSTEQALRELVQAAKAALDAHWGPILDQSSEDDIFDALEARLTAAEAALAAKENNNGRVISS